MPAVRAIALLFVLTAVTGWLLVRGLAHTAAAVEPTLAARQIQSVAFAGEDLPLALLRGALHTRIGDQLDDQRLASDRATLQAALVGTGYLDAAIVKPTVTAGEHGGVYVTFDIAQGPLFKIASVAVTGVPAGDATSAVTLRVGDDAIPAQVDVARAQLSDYLVRHGKLVTVTAVQHVDHAAGTVAIELVVAPRREPGKA
jgi:outer membrane protein assembly factor BamA